MDALINGLLDLSRLAHKEVIREPVSLSDMANDIVTSIQNQEPERPAAIHIQQDITAKGDSRMLYSVLENLLNNAWKYSSKRPQTEIKVFTEQQDGNTVYVIQDNGAGFSMKYADKLFVTFQRLHTESEFTGTGVGLATVKRIIEKHSGDIWAESEVDQGSKFYFTLP
jgi:light-regulated signal transduction histidine kinase (bacteriophytochrome)